MAKGVPVISSDSGGLKEAKLGTNYVIPVTPISKYKNEFDEDRKSSSDVPLLCSYGVECKKVDSRVTTSRLRHKSGKRFRRNTTRNKKSKHSKCEHKLSIEAFGKNFTICIVKKSFQKESITKEAW